VIVVDTSVWIDHLRAGDKELARLLEHAYVLMHPWVLGEIALGNLRQRDTVLDALRNLPQLPCADDTEVLHFIESAGLGGTGIGYVDAHILAAARLTPGTTIWTRDRRLLSIAGHLNLASGLG
jgi:predicted nucleic acid-binding protein